MQNYVRGSRAVDLKLQHGAASPGRLIKCSLLGPAQNRLCGSEGLREEQTFHS